MGGAGNDNIDDFNLGLDLDIGGDGQNGVDDLGVDDLGDLFNLDFGNNMGMGPGPSGDQVLTGARPWRASAGP